MSLLILLRMSQDQEDNQGRLSDPSPMIPDSWNYRCTVLYVCIFGAQAMSSTNCGCLLFRSWKGITKPHQDHTTQESLQKEKILCFKIFATCHYFCHCKAQHRCQQYRNGQEEKNKTIKNKTLKEKKKQNPQSIFSLPSLSPKSL